MESGGQKRRRPGRITGRHPQRESRRGGDRPCPAHARREAATVLERPVRRPVGAAFAGSDARNEPGRNISGRKSGGENVPRPGDPLCRTPARLPARRLFRRHRNRGPSRATTSVRNAAGHRSKEPNFHTASRIRSSTAASRTKTENSAAHCTAARSNSSDSAHRTGTKVCPDKSLNITEPVEALQQHKPYAP
jgi:hypothetical protein